VQKNNLLIFSSFLDIWENVEWPRFFGPPGTLLILVVTVQLQVRGRWLVDDGALLWCCHGNVVELPWRLIAGRDLTVQCVDILDVTQGC